MLGTEANRFATSCFLPLAFLGWGSSQIRSYSGRPLTQCCICGLGIVPHIDRPLNAAPSDLINWLVSTVLTLKMPAKLKCNEWEKSFGKEHWWKSFTLSLKTGLIYGFQILGVWNIGRLGENPSSDLCFLWALKGTSPFQMVLHYHGHHESWPSPPLLSSSGNSSWELVALLVSAWWPVHTQE